jgi:hypothetical protein
VALDAPRDPFDAGTPDVIRRQIYAWGNDGALDRLLLDWPELDDGRPSRAALELIQAWPKPRFPLAGADIVKLGVAQGPRVGEILAQVEGWWLAADFRPDRGQCLARARTLTRG